MVETRPQPREETGDQVNPLGEILWPLPVYQAPRIAGKIVEIDPHRLEILRHLFTATMAEFPVWRPNTDPGQAKLPGKVSPTFPESGPPLSPSLDHRRRTENGRVSGSLRNISRHVEGRQSEGHSRDLRHRRQLTPRGEGQKQFGRPFFLCHGLTLQHGGPLRRRTVN
ncbi:hypothetical protein Bbelb_219950 [Branchiostoma belcheri]|nr:hypothetical protein Bbelb_219950 [Branchiostoma belcheri]